MALKIYKDAGFTQEVTALSPLTTQHPIAGSTVDTKVYLRNDDATKYYTTISVDPQDTTATDESTWVFLAPDSAGSPGTFGVASAALSMADIGVAGTGDTTGKPFWVRVTTPSVGTTQNKTDIFLNVTGREFAV